MSRQDANPFDSGQGQTPNPDTFTTQPLPASTKVYVAGNLPGVRVAMREIALGPTAMADGNPAT